jgi:hypothetical protein
MKGEFPDKIQLEDVGMSGESRIFKTLARFRFYSKRFGLIEVPSGTYTDGASIPKIFWSIMSPYGDMFEAALPHDHLYSPSNENLTRAESDQVLREGMEIIDAYRVEQLTGWRRHVAKARFTARRAAVYRSVRMFGWSKFKGTKK